MKKNIIKNIIMKCGNNSKLVADSIYLRKMIYVLGENYFNDEDVYDKDAFHVVVYQNEKAIGAGRWFMASNGYNISGVCVDREYRNFGVGSIIVNKLLKDIESCGGNKIFTAVELDKINFCEKFGFKKTVKIIFRERRLMRIMLKIF